MLVVPDILLFIGLVVVTDGGVENGGD